MAFHGITDAKFFDDLMRRWQHFV